MLCCLACHALYFYDVMCPCLFFFTRFLLRCVSEEVGVGFATDAPFFLEGGWRRGACFDAERSFE